MYCSMVGHIRNRRPYPIGPYYIIQSHIEAVCFGYIEAHTNAIIRPHVGPWLNVILTASLRPVRPYDSRRSPNRIAWNDVCESILEPIFRLWFRIQLGHIEDVLGVALRVTFLFSRAMPRFMFRFESYSCLDANKIQVPF